MGYIYGDQICATRRQSRPYATHSLFPSALMIPYAAARFVRGRANVEPTHARSTEKLELSPPVRKKMDRYRGAVVVVVAARMKPTIANHIGVV